jgi:hypothetical protein
MSDDAQNSIFRQESLERLSSPEQLDQLIQVVTPKSWLPLATLGSLVFLLMLWSIFGRIPITATGKGVLVYANNSSNDLVSLSYFKSGEGEQIQPGTRIMIVPDTAISERSSGIWARVKEIATPTVTTLEAARQIEKSDTGLASGTVEVVAELEHDSSTASGYKWSSMAGQHLKIIPGTTTTVHLTLAEKSPITFIFPFLEVSN